MTNFLDDLRAELTAFDLQCRRVLVAISGGADSVALLLGLCELSAEWELHLTAGHLDHGLRGADSAADAVWVKNFCDRLSVPCVIERQDPGELEPDTKQTLEESARRARYDFLERTAVKLDCTEIAVAHTADDQAETVLHHILRGTGISGLRGIPRQRELSPKLRIVRPLLDIRRVHIENWLTERNQDFRKDASNRDPAFTRNRIRHQLLPLLEEEYNPQVIPALTRLGRQAGETEDAFHQLAEEQLEAAVRDRSPRHCRLDCEPLNRLPLAIRRVVFTTLWRQQNWPRKRMTFAHWNDLADLVRKKNGAISLPAGLTARRQRDGLTVEWSGGKRSAGTDVDTT